MLDLFNVDKLIEDTPKIPDNPCGFENCYGEAVSTVCFQETVGKLEYDIPICEKCLERAQTENPRAERYSTSRNKKLIRVYWKDKS